MQPSEPELAPKTRKMASYVAMVIRNAMEDFHCEHLSDAQMKQLNPIVRNAVGTALHAFFNYEDSVQARQFVDFHFASIPRYWEPPELLDDYRCLGESGSQAT